MSPFVFQGPDADRNYSALKSISDRLGYDKPSKFVFDFQNKAPELRLAQGEDPLSIYTYIFDAIELEKMNLTTPKIIGFGISNNENFSIASKYSKGCIVGSAFIKYIQKMEFYQITSLL